MIQPSKKSIIIADDHVSVREGLAQIIEGCEGVEIVAYADNGHSLVKLVELKKPDLVISDIRMPEMDGLDAAGVIKGLSPGTRMIAYIADETDYLFLQLLQADFSGIVLKRSSKKEMIMALHIVLGGDEYFCTYAQERINHLIRKGLYNPRKRFVKPLLSEREEEILLMICRGMITRQIAEKLHLSTRTIESYRENLLKKTGSVNPAGLVYYAYKEGLIQNIDKIG